MIGVLNSTCKWQKKTTNKYNETIISTPPTILPCTAGQDLKLKRTEAGLESFNEVYYILHSVGVQTGDLINGQEVAVSEIKDLGGRTAYYKAVVLNG